eukprot:Tamp_14209.p1 GENE.Tamp_14209~~Tamp_14209.p1  ORF type:complete len:265 (+),score=44.94 Tamp_14209:263-1057(+)
MHKGQLSIMFVGGPNTRTDFHVEEGSELFLQLKGDMELPTVQEGKRKLVKIPQGHLFVLPSRVPHSPQRQENSLGLVIERCREAGEMDALRWYTDFQVCDEVLFERYFRCEDLGRDLVPVVQEFKASSECATGKKTETSIPPPPAAIVENSSISVPDPIHLIQYMEGHMSTLAGGGQVDVLKDLGHPDKEFSVVLEGGSSQSLTCHADTFFYQLRGSASMSIKDSEPPVQLEQGMCITVIGPETVKVERAQGSVGLVITQRKCQ